MPSHVLQCFLQALRNSKCEWKTTRMVEQPVRQWESCCTPEWSQDTSCQFPAVVDPILFESCYHSQSPWLLDTVQSGQWNNGHMLCKEYSIAQTTIHIVQCSLLPETIANKSTVILTCTGWTRPCFSTSSMTFNAVMRTCASVWKNASSNCFRYTWIMVDAILKQHTISLTSGRCSQIILVKIIMSNGTCTHTSMQKTKTKFSRKRQHPTQTANLTI